MLERIVKENPRFLHTKTLDLIVLGFLSSIVSLVILVWGEPTWYADSHSYIQFAETFSRRFYAPTLYWRTVGYPLVIILSGAMTGSLLGLFILQAAAGAAIPVLSYLALAQTSRATRLAAGLVSIASLTPYCFIKTVYPDQFYIVSLVLITVLTIRWTTIRQTSAWIYIIAAFGTFLTWLRPAGTSRCPLLLPRCSFASPAYSPCNSQRRRHRDR